jgi:hypothetical protein
LLKGVLAEVSLLGEYFLEQPDMRRVKALMIGKLSLTWLWPILWLVALPNSQAHGMRPTESIPAAIIEASTSENQVSHDFGIYFHSVRSARRFELHAGPNETPGGLCLFKIEIGRNKNNFSPLVGRLAPLGLASGWQFLWRTALSPRAPSFVS